MMMKVSEILKGGLLWFSFLNVDKYNVCPCFSIFYIAEPVDFRKCHMGT